MNNLQIITFEAIEMKKKNPLNFPSYNFINQKFQSNINNQCI